MKYWKNRRSGRENEIGSFCEILAARKEAGGKEVENQMKGLDSRQSVSSHEETCAGCRVRKTGLPALGGENTILLFE